MADLLLLIDINLKVADHHDPALSADIVFAAAKLAGRHVPLHNVDAVFLIEGNARHLVEADDIVLTHEAALPARHVDEHLGDRRLTTGNEMGIGGDLLEQMTLPRAS